MADGIWSKDRRNNPFADFFKESTIVWGSVSRLDKDMNLNQSLPGFYPRGTRKRQGRAKKFLLGSVRFCALVSWQQWRGKKSNLQEFFFKTLYNWPIKLYWSTGWDARKKRERNWATMNPSKAREGRGERIHRRRRFYNSDLMTHLPRRS